MSAPSESSPENQSLTPKKSESPSTAAKEKGRFHFCNVLSRWWGLALLFIVITSISIVVSNPSWMDIHSPRYEATILVEVKPIGAETSSKAGVPITRNFISLNFESPYVAPATLELALEKNDLLNRLGGDRHQAFKRMAQSIRTVDQSQDANLFTISYRDDDAGLAHDACTAVYEAYRERREQLEMAMRKSQLQAIQTELRSKKDRLRELKKRLHDIASKVGVTGLDLKSSLPQLIRKEFDEATRDMEQVSAQVNSLQAPETKDLIAIAAELPEIGFKGPYQEYLEAEKEIEKMKSSGLTEKHPEIQQRRQRINTLENKLEKQAILVRDSLQFRLLVIKQRLETLRPLVNKKKSGGTLLARQIQEFDIARKEHRTALQIKDQMEVRFDIEKTKIALPPSINMVHPTPVTRDKRPTLILSMTFLLSGLTGLGILLMYSAEATFPTDSP